AKDGTIVIGSDDHKVYALADERTTARLKWTATTGDDVQSSPVIDRNGVVFIGSDDRKVPALDPSSGETLWIAATQGAVRSSPAIGANGTIYVGSDDGRLYSFWRFDSALILVDHLQAIPSANSFAEPPLTADGNANPDGLKEI